MRVKNPVLSKSSWGLTILSGFTFVFVSIFGFLLWQRADVLEEQTSAVLGETSAEFMVSDLPKLKGSNAPSLSAQGIMVVDWDSGMVLYEKNADRMLLPASTTKIMTALVAMDYYSVDDVLSVGSEAVVEGQKMGLISGERISVDNLLQGLLIYSANDAAETLAVNFPGGREGFVFNMNEKAKSLGLTNTSFENPSGLDGIDHFSTARDLVSLSEVAMQEEWFSGIVSRENAVVTSADGVVAHSLRNINELLGSVDGVLGVKTGWTERAAENLVTYVRRDGRNVLMAVMGSQDRFGETKQLIDWVFGNYEWVSLGYSTP